VGTKSGEIEESLEPLRVSREEGQPLRRPMTGRIRG
jgi:hypothetical protein